MKVRLFLLRHPLPPHPSWLLYSFIWRLYAPTSLVNMSYLLFISSKSDDIDQSLSVCPTLPSTSDIHPLCLDWSLLSSSRFFAVFYYLRIRILPAFCLVVSPMYLCVLLLPSHGLYATRKASCFSSSASLLSILLDCVLHVCISMRSPVRFSASFSV